LDLRGPASKGREGTGRVVKREGGKRERGGEEEGNGRKREGRRKEGRNGREGRKGNERGPPPYFVQGPRLVFLRFKNVNGDCYSKICLLCTAWLV